jgi:protein involved in polysaccharide export with SLBB domain
MTTADLIDQAGGFTQYASRFLEIRRLDGSYKTYRMKLGRQSTNDVDLIVPNIPLRPGDQVLSPRF